MRGIKRRRSELESRLISWGYWFGPLPAPEWDEDSSLGVGVLMQRAIEKARVSIAPILDEPAIHGRWKREDGARYFEPQRWTAKGKPSESGQRVWNPDPEADEVERAVLQLHRINHLRAVCLRGHYCIRQGRKEGARWATVHAEVPVTVRRYRAEIELARMWVGGQLALCDQEAA